MLENILQEKSTASKQVFKHVPADTRRVVSEKRIRGVAPINFHRALTSGPGGLGGP